MDPITTVEASSQIEKILTTDSGSQASDPQTNSESQTEVLEVQESFQQTDLASLTDQESQIELLTPNDVEELVLKVQ